ncbi:hypothetical protein SprV_0100337400 [Sparganum proliferum]
MRPPHDANAQPLPTCLRCQRTFRARIGLISHLRIHCASRTAATAVPPSPSSSLSPPLTTSDCSPEPPPPPSSPSSSSSSSSSYSSTVALAAVTHVNTTHNPDATTDTTLQTRTPEVRTRNTPALTVHAHSAHTSAWSVTCESIAQRLTNQCLEHQPTPTALASTVPTALALSRIVWAYSAPCAFTRVELTAILSHQPRQAPPSLYRPARPPRSPQLTPTPPISPAPTVHAYSPLASAWSVTCESIAQRLTNQCLEHQPTPTALASTVHTALAHSRIAWPYSATCASTNTCGRQPPDAQHHHTLPPPSPPPHHTPTLTHRKHPTATSHASGNSASRPGLLAASAERET